MSFQFFDAEVALIIFSQKGRLYEFSRSKKINTKCVGNIVSTPIDWNNERFAKIIDIMNLIYQQSCKLTILARQVGCVSHSTSPLLQLKHEAALMSKKIELLQNSYRKLLGHNLGTCSIEELQDIDEQLERSLKNIRSRREKFLLGENERLCKKIGLKQRHVQEKIGQQEIGNCS
ncbi:MADS box transcription factor [Handroanthus impetiginosus]|uniref:MADS box transcription factor n=1 Tax=Handroanthus impetiginosus TaxID=429701 RepID=A0A2G9GKW0_9LAMI|nr:MADS box transcription factor [Handroanthus impetiginosus]